MRVDGKGLGSGGKEGGKQIKNCLPREAVAEAESGAARELINICLISSS